MLVLNNNKQAYNKNVQIVIVLNNPIDLLTPFKVVVEKLGRRDMHLTSIKNSIG